VNSEFLPFHKPDIGEAEAEAVLDTLRSGWLTTGSKVKQFEGDFAKYLGCSHAVAVNSGTSALHLALLAAGIGSGDEVITVPFTFVATAAAIAYTGARQVFVDPAMPWLMVRPWQVQGVVRLLGTDGSAPRTTSSSNNAAAYGCRGESCSPSPAAPTIVVTRARWPAYHSRFWATLSLTCA